MFPAFLCSLKKLSLLSWTTVIVAHAKALRDVDRYDRLASFKPFKGDPYNVAPSVSRISSSFPSETTTVIFFDAPTSITGVACLARLR